MAAKVLAVSVSRKKGTAKENVAGAHLVEEHGIAGDAHAGEWHRQVSMLAAESIDKMKDRGLEVGPGDFAENLTTEGIDLLSLQIGDKLRLGSGAVLEITQKGKECHDRCAVFNRVGDCVMPREGIFARVRRGGSVRPGDSVELIPPDETV
jgi:MOSC domain-containing protein YiiM